VTASRRLGFYCGHSTDVASKSDRADKRTKAALSQTNVMLTYR
jgi:hypothetical protein